MTMTCAYGCDCCNIVGTLPIGIQCECHGKVCLTVATYYVAGKYRDVCIIGGVCEVMRSSYVKPIHIIASASCRITIKLQLA